MEVFVGFCIISSLRSTPPFLLIGSFSQGKTSIAGISGAELYNLVFPGIALNESKLHIR